MTQATSRADEILEDRGYEVLARAKRNRDQDGYMDSDVVLVTDGDQFITWVQSVDKRQFGPTFWGHYFQDQMEANEDWKDRANLG